MIDVKLNDPTLKIVAGAGAATGPEPRQSGDNQESARETPHPSQPASATPTYTPDIAALIGRADDLADYASNLTGQLEKAVREHVPEDQRDGLYRDLRHYLTKAADAFDGMREVGVELDKWARRRVS